MKIGACGIACEVCGLFSKGACGGCVSGNDRSVSLVLDAQKKQFGFSCPVLKCASRREVGYCLRDCNDFPCDVLYRGFPYGKGFLDLFKKG